ncbi:polyadenylate-binding protein 3-like [Musa acuminata AAA Group]|uniref:polyadenylate-binding protein 3-like n=1 Tax=Musa acuminata AAA Group TaxID=214697 RepID=UPI0031DDB088
MEEEEHEIYGGEIPDEVDSVTDVETSNTAAELGEMKKRLKAMDEEAAALREIQAKVEKEMSAIQDPASTSASETSKAEVDSRSVFVGNVSPQFRSLVNTSLMRVFIPCNARYCTWEILWLF